MKRITLACCLLISALIASIAQAKNEVSLDQIVAIVNDDVVTTSELNHSLATIKMQIAHENAPRPPEDVLKKQVLDQLINKKLQLQIAKQAGITVTEEDLNKTVERIAAQNRMSVRDLYQRLNAEGMSTADYRREMRDQLTLTKLQQQEVVSHITVTPQDVDRFMKAHPWQQAAKEYRLEDIIVPVSDTPSPNELEAAKKRANGVFAELKQGQDLKTITRAEKGVKPLESNDLGWRHLAEIPSAFVDRVVNMQPQQLAGPIQTPNGFHIIRLTEVRLSSGNQPAPTRKDVENLLLQRKFEEAVQHWVSKLRSQAYIVMNPTTSNVRPA